jgi:hypothetical protein
VVYFTCGHVKQPYSQSFILRFLKTQSGQTGMTSHTFTRGSTSETHWHICNFLVTFTVLDVMLNITTKNLILFDMRKTLMHGLFIIILMDLFNLN